MQTNTVQTLIDSIKDLTGQSNLSTEKAIRALNYGVDDYTRQRILASGKWSPDSSNHGDIARMTTTLSAGSSKLSLPTELIAIRQIEILVESKYYIVEPTDIHDHSDEPLDTKYGTTGLPKVYDVHSNHAYFYPTTDASRTVRVTYRRAHPRFSADNLTQDVGVMQIDDEYVVLYAADYVAIGVSDSARPAIAEKLAIKKKEIKDTFGSLDQDTSRAVRTKAKTPFSSNSFNR